jgi:hypothetical protein
MMVKRGRPKTPKGLAEAMCELRKLRAEVASVEAAARHRQPAAEIDSSSSSRERDPDEDQIA